MRLSNPRPTDPTVRRPAVAGRFYPADPSELRRTVEEFLASVTAPTGPAPKALVVPHAGYVFSGPIAASAYARLLPARERITRVVLVGPAHFHDFRGLALPGVEAFATSLGLVPIDAEAARTLERMSEVSVVPAAHEEEHSLEVQLPFLQVVLTRFSLVPLVVGRATPEDVGRVLEAVWGGPETCVVISSDLSHYHTWEVAHRMDEATARAVEALAPEHIHEDQACGRVPLAGLLGTARDRKLSAHTLDLRNSGDTAGPRDHVVGYGAFAVF